MPWATRTVGTRSTRGGSSGGSSDRRARSDSPPREVAPDERAAAGDAEPLGRGDGRCARAASTGPSSAR